MKAIITPSDKAKVTLAVKAYLEAKAAERKAKEAAELARKELLAVMDGDKDMDWSSDDGRKYRIVATYNKTSRSLNADLIKSILGVEVTEDCYKVSKSWDEIRITILG